jgi:hypothetical protein
MLDFAEQDLDKTLASQQSLDQLCSDRPLETDEIFAGNAFYGNDAALKAYAGLRRTYGLKVVVPHGIVFRDDHIWKSEAKALLPAVLCYPPYRERIYAEKTNKAVFPAAAPFLYVLELLKGQPEPSRRGTIFFPAHSTHYITAQMDFSDLAESLQQLDSEYQPVTICIYWRDFNLGHHIPFVERGFRIVSAGHMYDPLFLARFYHLCSLNRYSASNSIGSSLFYSVKSGCSFFLLDAFGASHVAADDVLKRDMCEVPLTTRSTLTSLFAVPQPSITAEQIEVVDYYLGAMNLKSPRALCQQLYYAEMLDRVGIVIRNREQPTRFTFPTYCRRMLCTRIRANGHRLKRNHQS